MTRLATFALLALCSPVFAKTEKYRVIWNQSPETNVTIGWCQVDGETPQVKYGKAGEATLRNLAGAGNSVSHHGMLSKFARIGGLEPDTAYEFVVFDSNSESRRFSFKTAPAGAAEFSFVAGGDSRNHRDARQRANKTVALLQPLFVCFGGDMINKSTPKEWNDWLDDWQLTTTADGRMTPIIAARGNHEGKKDIHSFFDTPNADDYYAVPIGGDYLRVYTLNSSITRAGSQGKWLAEDLAKHEKATWKIAHYHHPFRPHQSGKAEQHAQYNAWAKLFFDHGLNLAIECDSHVVKRTWPLRPSNEPGSEQGFIRDDIFGTTFVGEGCWGAPLRAANDVKSWTRASGSFNQVNWIQVTPKEITARSVKVDSIDKVTGKIDPANPFDVPEGLEIWDADHGAIVTIRPRGLEGRPALAAQDFARLKITAAETEFTDSTVVYIRYDGGDHITDREIRYTTDGSDPSSISTVYSGPFKVTDTTTVRAAIFRSPKQLTEPETLTLTKKAAE